MLRSLSIQNLAVIEDAQIDLDRGLNVFTGTTGAGKSLVIGALELLLGLRASADMVRTGAKEARVSAMFEIASSTVREEIEQALDLTLDDGQLLIQRRLPAAGASRASLNGQAITAAMLRRLGQILVDIHGQYDQQYLLQPVNQLAVLDVYGKLEPARTAYRAVYDDHRAALDRKAALEAGRDLRQQQLELYEFQADELDRAALSPGEIDDLEARRRRLANAERLAADLGAVNQSLYEAEGSVVDRLKAVAAALENLLPFDASLETPAAAARESAFTLENLAFDLRGAAQRVESDPAALAEVDDRLHLLKKLCSKYGGNEGEVLAYRETLAEKIAALRNQDEDASQIDADLARLHAEMIRLGQDLHARRLKVAAGLQKKIEAELRQLAMKEARFSIAVEPAVGEDGQITPSPTGLDQVEFLIAPNPGEPPKPVRKIASGGELSRVMLALKSVLALADRISVLVFDEIDANVGGRLGSVIGRKLSDLAAHHQVLCITHLPQIASFADSQLTVRKQSRQGRSFTVVESVTGDRRIAELAEMIGGKDVTETTRQQARELLALARK